MKAIILKGATSYEVSICPGVRPKLSTGGTNAMFPMKLLRHLHDSDRALVLTCLAIPVALAVVAFILAVGLTAFGVPKLGTLRSTTAGIAYVYLTLGLIWLPAYIIGGAWFWWATRDDEDNVLKRLYTMPLIAALFVWFPTLYFTAVPLAQKVRMYPMVALTAIIAGFIWVGFVRLMFYAWRRK